MYSLPLFNLLACLFLVAGISCYGFPRLRPIAPLLIYTGCIFFLVANMIVANLFRIVVFGALAFLFGLDSVDWTKKQKKPPTETP